MVNFFKKKRSLVIILILVVLGIFAVIYIIGLIIPVVTTYEYMYSASGPYEVVRVIDGDTFVVTIDDTETTIRMIGIDAPESVASEDYYEENTPEGLVASEFTKKLLSSASVALEYDVETTDKYGRTLAYVYLDDMTMINELLLENGMAELCIIPPNEKYSDRFYSAMKKAKKEKKGFYGTGFFK